MAWRDLASAVRSSSLDQSATIGSPAASQELSPPLYQNSERYPSTLSLSRALYDFAASDRLAINDQRSVQITVCKGQHRRLKLLLPRVVEPPFVRGHRHPDGARQSPFRGHGLDQDKAIVAIELRGQLARRQPRRNGYRNWRFMRDLLPGAQGQLLRHIEITIFLAMQMSWAAS